jgi:soluble lytic murein transglycosylase
MRNKKLKSFTSQSLLVGSLAMLAVFSPQAIASVEMSPAVVNDDDRFMALRDAAMHGDSKAVQLHAAALSNYSIPSYVDYYVLRTRLSSASSNDILQFFEKI